jgi:hypothetical protein
MENGNRWLIWRRDRSHANPDRHVTYRDFYIYENVVRRSILAMFLLAVGLGLISVLILAWLTHSVDESRIQSFNVICQVEQERANRTAANSESTAVVYRFLTASVPPAQRTPEQRSFARLLDEAAARNDALAKTDRNFAKATCSSRDDLERLLRDLQTAPPP